MKDVIIVEDYKIAELIVQHLKMKGLSQTEFAKMLDVEDYTVSRWCNGKSIPDANAFINIARVLDIRIDHRIKSHEELMKENEILAMYQTLNDYERQCLLSIIKSAYNMVTQQKK